MQRRRWGCSGADEGLAGYSFLSFFHCWRWRQRDELWTFCYGFYSWTFPPAGLGLTHRWGTHRLGFAPETWWCLARWKCCRCLRFSVQFLCFPSAVPEVFVLFTTSTETRSELRSIVTEWYQRLTMSAQRSKNFGYPEEKLYATDFSKNNVMNAD